MIRTSVTFQNAVIALKADGCSQREIATRLHTSCLSVRQICNYFDTYKEVPAPLVEQQQQIPGGLTQTELNFLAHKMQTEPHTYLDEYAAALAAQCGRKYSISTIHRALKHLNHV
jgi:transposase